MHLDLVVVIPILMIIGGMLISIYITERQRKMEERKMNDELAAEREAIIQDFMRTMNVSREEAEKIYRDTIKNINDICNELNELSKTLSSITRGEQDGQRKN